MARIQKVDAAPRFTESDLPALNRRLEEVVGEISRRLNAIIDGNLPAGVVSGTEIADGSVTTPKIADLAVTNPKVGLAAINTAQIADFAVSVTKQISGLLFIAGAVWSNNTPIAGDVSWSACTVVYNGVQYAIVAGNSNLKYIYWQQGVLNTQFQASNVFPVLGDNDFLIAVNNAGIHELIWNQAKAQKWIPSGLIDDAAIITSKIADAAVIDTKIGAAAVINSKIADGAVSTTKIGDLQVSTAKLIDGSVITAKLGDVQVTTQKLADGAITTIKLGDSQVIAQKLADGSVTLTKFLSGLRPVQVVAVLPPLPDAVNYPQGATVFLTTDNKLYRSTGATWTVAIPVADLSGQITTTQITDGAITTIKLGDAQVTLMKLADGSVSQTKIQAGNRILHVVAALPALPDAAYPQGAVAFLTTDNKLYRSDGNAWTKAVDGTADIIAGSITTGSITAGAITAALIAAGAVIAGKIAADAVTSTEIAANAVIAAKIAAGAVIAGKIAAGAVSTAELAAGAITADKLVVGIQAGLSESPENIIKNGGGEKGTLGAQANDWTFSGGNALKVAEDQVLLGARSLKIDNPIAADSHSLQDIAVVAGAIYELQGWIKTTALPIADPGQGAVFNIEPVTGGLIFTVLDKIGDDFGGGAQPDVGVAATGVAVDWTFVRSRFIPSISGTIRLYCQLGYGGVQSGTAWYDGVVVRRLNILKTSDLVDAIITSAKIANLAVQAAHIDNLAVATGKIADLAVAAGKIADLAVGTGKIADLSVTTGKIALLAVTNALIADLAVDTAKIAALAVTNAKINDMAADKITTGLLSVLVGLGATGNPSITLDGVNRLITITDAGGIARVKIGRVAL